MAKKQYYAINFRSYHTAVHGLICFSTRKEAEQKYNEIQKWLKEIERETEEIPNNREMLEAIFYDNLNNIINNSALYLHEVNFREYKEGTIRNRLEKYYIYNDTKCIIVNWNSFDL